MKRRIRLATDNDLPRMQELIEFGRQKMRIVGNVDQWTNGNPRRELIEQDIADGNGYIVEDDGQAVATFAFIEGPDITYGQIYDGQWLDEIGEYSRYSRNTQGRPRQLFHSHHKHPRRYPSAEYYHAPCPRKIWLSLLRHYLSP